MHRILKLVSHSPNRWFDQVAEALPESLDVGSDWSIGKIFFMAEA